MTAQLLNPDDYARLMLPDQWIEDEMQAYQAEILCRRIRPRSRVLELGYGAGIITRALLRHGCAVTTVDGSAELVQRASEDGAWGVHSWFEHLTDVLAMSSMQAVPAWDCVLASFVLEHVVDPVALLRNCRLWSDKLFVTVGNADSHHRMLATSMRLHTDNKALSERDRTVGHYRVYDIEDISNELQEAGWCVQMSQGVMFKPLPNALLSDLPRDVVRGMIRMPVPVYTAANIMLECV